MKKIHDRIGHYIFNEHDDYIEMCANQDHSLVVHDNAAVDAAKESFKKKHNPKKKIIYVGF